MKRIKFGYLICFWLILCSSARSELVTLYGGSGLPAAEPWLVFGADTIGGWSQTAVAGGVRLTTVASVFGIGCCAARRMRNTSKGPIGSKV